MEVAQALLAKRGDEGVASGKRGGFTDGAKQLDRRRRATANSSRVGDGGALNKASLLETAVPSLVRDKGLKSTLGIRIHKCSQTVPHCKVFDARGGRERRKARVFMEIDFMESSSNTLDKFLDQEQLSNATVNRRLKDITMANNSRDHAATKRTSRVEHGSSSTGIMSTKACKDIECTLIGGMGGNTRQYGKIILPQFTISEARETKAVFQALQEDDQWTPRVDQALWALSPKLQTRILARILKRQTNPSLAWKLFQWAESLPGFEHDSSTFYALIEVLGKAEDLQAIWTLINDMRIADIKVKQIPFTFLISGYGRAGKIKEAEMTLHSMREFNCKPNVYTYNAILFALFKAHKTERALFTFQKMLAYGCQPDDVTFNTLINGLCVDNHIEAAAFYLDEMLKMGLSPDMRTFNIVIRNYLKSAQLQKALNVYELALKTGCTPSTITHSMLLKFLFEMGMFKAALNLFKEMVNSSCDLDVVACTTFLHGLFKYNKREMAFAFFDSLVKTGCANVATFNVVLDWFCKKKEVDKAVEVVQDMKRSGVLPNTLSYNSLIMGSFKDGRAGMGLAFVSQMMEENCIPDLITYTLLMDFFLKKEEVEDAVVLFKEMSENGLQPDIVVYNHLLLGLFRAGRITLALSVAKEMIRKGCHPDRTTYRVLNYLLQKQGQSCEALKFIEEMACLDYDAGSLWQIPDSNTVCLLE